MNAADPILQHACARTTAPRGRVLLGMAVFALAACRLAAAPPLVPYLDPVDLTRPPPSDLVLRVDFVVAGGPAARHGMQPRDLIVALDGLRTRTTPDYNLVQRVKDSSAPLELDINRGGAWVKLVIPPLPGRRCLFGFHALSSPIVGRLLAWDVEIPPIPSHDPPPEFAWDAPPSSASDAITGYGPRSWAVLERAPGRVREAFRELLARRREEDRAWLETLIRGWMLLLREDYGAAGREIAPLLTAPTHPFLDQYARFLAAVAREQGAWRNADDWTRCGVDAAFFAICYPYPLVPRANAGGFATDPSLQAAFDRGAWCRGEAEYARLQEDGGAFLRPDLPPVEGYVSQVKAALVSIRQHGGWPYRSSLIVGNKRAEMLALLKQRLAERPDDRLATSYALLYPSLATGDNETFRTALETIHAAGPDYAAAANRILRNAASYRGISDGEWHAVWTDVDERHSPRPAIFQYLASRCPVLAECLSLGWFSRAAVVEDAAMFASARPYLIYESLVASDDGAELAWILDAARDPGAMSDAGVRDLFGRLAGQVRRQPETEPYATLVQLAERVPRDQATRALTDVALGIRDFREIGAIRTVRRPSQHWARLLENGDAEAVATAQAVLDHAGPAGAIGSLCQDALAKAGTPAGAVILAAAALRGGDKAAAGRLFALAENFHSANEEPRARSTALWAMRDLLAAEGFEDEAARFIEGGLESNDRRAYLLAAGVALRKGRPGEARSLLGRADSSIPRLEGGPATLVWQGKRLSPDEFAATLRDALAAAQPAVP